MSSAQAQPKSIPTVIVGIHRATAIDTTAILDGTPFYIAAIMDLHESPLQYQHTPHNLGAVLHALYPRPKVLVTGTAVQSYVADTRKVWQEYVEKTLKAEEGDDVKAVYVPVSNCCSAACEH